MRRRSILNTSERRTALLVSSAVSVAVLVLATGAGSVFVPPDECLSVIARHLFGTALPQWVKPSHDGIIWSLRLPRVLLAFVAGGALSASGAVMQSVLKNPLASSFTLGVSAGASLGAAIVILGAGSEIAWVAAASAFPLSVPAAGFLFSLATMLAVMRFARAADRNLSNGTIILAGMVFSLLVNAALTLLSAFSAEGINRLVFWQMGSFALKGWTPLFICAPVLALSLAVILGRSRELDILTFSDDEATAMGVPVRRTRSQLVILTSVMTGIVVSFVGVIGFLDLAVPHMVRRIVGPAHRDVVPLSVLSGGVFMVLADLAARTLFPPVDLPVGAITAIVGAPLFGWIYLSSRKEMS